MGKKRILKAVPEVQISAPQNALPTDAELESLLDEVSDEEFGLVQASEVQRAVLKEWSAQDFANIYTRFRPHLERHARRMLRNQSQIDEVVQDAFLYLMVTLPELDSEIGVLRFLKWKVRLLCLDVIRASGRAIMNNIDEVAEPASNDPEVGSDLEQAEDAAIVRLALSKLNPRHREVLLASMYEEKSTREIAEQVGLSENATLQLLFRARAAFKKALLGDIDTEGMSMSKILSVATRKAAEEAKRVGAQAMVFALFLMLAVGGFISLGNRGTTATLAEAEKTPAASNPTPSVSNPGGSIANNISVAQPSSTPSASSVIRISSTSTPAPVQSTSPFTAAQVFSIYSNDPTSAGAIRNASVAGAGAVGFDVYDNIGNHAAITITPVGDKFNVDALFDFTIDGVKYFSYLQGTTISVETVDGVQVLNLSGVVKQPFDSRNRVWDQSPLVGTQVKLQLPFGSSVLKATDAVLSISAPAK
jgi:RNA polymerase sigma-70 factor (ECF subfamily)